VRSRHDHNEKLTEVFASFFKKKRFLKQFFFEGKIGRASNLVEVQLSGK
jgi:hypothetical protein